MRRGLGVVQRLLEPAEVQAALADQQRAAGAQRRVLALGGFGAQFCGQAQGGLKLPGPGQAPRLVQTGGADGFR